MQKKDITELTGSEELSLDEQQQIAGGELHGGGKYLFLEGGDLKKDEVFGGKKERQNLI
ncbi:MAG: hypothetical protein IJS28_01000 [Synergistaceae bacterium]|nr:hypothetical protein [Synergistaceae bacterium]